jgi:hypothetical protein
VRTAYIDVVYLRRLSDDLLRSFYWSYRDLFLPVPTELVAELDHRNLRP